MTEILDAAPFRVANTATYRFPFEVKDLTPGGGNLGRIEWQIEPQFTDNRVTRILVSVRQTRDLRYRGKSYGIECDAEAITARRHTQDSFFAGVWYIGFCTEHNATFFQSYPEDHHGVLVIETFSSISVDIHYE